MSTTVTIDKTYFETLLRKANVHGSEPHDDDHTSTVAVTRDYHDDLVRSVNEYRALRTALIRGGVTVENLELLINAGLQADPATAASGFTTGGRNGHAGSEALPAPSENGGVNLNLDELSSSAIQSYPTPSTTPSFRTQPHNHTAAHSGVQRYARNGAHRETYREQDDYAGSDGTEKQDIPEPRRGSAGAGGGANEYKEDSGGNRTLFFTRLPEKVTYSSFLETVRGGLVVDAWMKPSDRCGSISFLHPQSAEAFYRYAKRNDIYIDGRRVNVEWREPTRQFVVLPNILRQIHAGATRNLYLRNIPSTMTEVRLREDLDHIANLSIEKVVFDKARNAVQVNLNSVCVACFARTCLKSRAYYKGTKVEFGPDECAKSLPEFKAYKPKQPEAKARQERKASNRFDALALALEDEDAGDGNGDDDLTETEDWADSVEDGGERSW